MSDSRMAVHGRAGRALHGGVSVVAVCAISLWLCGLGPAPRAQEKHAADAEAPGNAGAVDIQMRNVNFRLARDIVLEVRTLRGELRRTKPEIPVTFDDNGSFTVQIDTAQVAITAA